MLEWLDSDLLKFTLAIASINALLKILGLVIIRKEIREVNINAALIYNKTIVSP